MLLGPRDLPCLNPAPNTHKRQSLQQGKSAIQRQLPDNPTLTCLLLRLSKLATACLSYRTMFNRRDKNCHRRSSRPRPSLLCKRRHATRLYRRVLIQRTRVSVSVGSLELQTRSGTQPEAINPPLRPPARSPRLPATVLLAAIPVAATWRTPRQNA